MNLSRYLGHVTIFGWVLTTASCLAVGLGLVLWLDVLTDSLVALRTYFYNFPLSLSSSTTRKAQIPLGRHVTSQHARHIEHVETWRDGQCENYNRCCNNMSRMNLSRYVHCRTCDYNSWMFTIPCCLVVARAMVGDRVRVIFRVWLVSCYAHVFVLLSIVIVTLLTWQTNWNFG